MTVRRAQPEIFLLGAAKTKERHAASQREPAGAYEESGSPTPKADLFLQRGPLANGIELSDPWRAVGHAATVLPCPRANGDLDGTDGLSGRQGDQQGHGIVEALAGRQSAHVPSRRPSAKTWKLS